MDDKLTRKFYNTAVFRQCVLALCISLSYLNIGMVRGYSSPAFPNIKQYHPYLLPTPTIASWAGSIPPCGALFGSLLAGPLLHYTGRKWTVLSSSPILALSWLLIALAPNWKCILAGRILSGFCAGLCLPSAQIYVTECTDAKIRGVIGCFPSLAMSGGILISYIIGTFVTYDYLAYINCGFAVILALAIAFLPESPTWLIGTQREKRAMRAKKWLKLERRGQHTISPSTADEAAQLRNDEYDEPEVNPHSMRVLMSRPILKPLGIGLTLLLIQQFSGIDSVIFFTVDIFRASGSSIDGNLAAIIVGSVQMLSNLSSLFVVDRFGRKPLLIGSACIMCVSTTFMGIAFYLNSIGNFNYGFLPLVSLIVFMVGYSIGFGSIPFLLMGEILPAAQRSLLSSLAGSFNLGAMFFVVKTYHPLEEVITTAGTFWIYSVLCAIGALFVIFCVPETKGRSTDEIARLFEKPKSPIVILNAEQRKCWDDM